MQRKYNYKYPTLLLLMLLPFCLIYVFCSQDPNLSYNTQLTISLQNIFMANFIHQHFSIFQFLILLISIYIIAKYGISISRSGIKERIIFFLYIVYIVFLMINPNNDTLNPIFGLPLLSDPSLYIALIFMAAIFFIKDTFRFILIIKTLIKTILVVAIIRFIILYILWFLGHGNISLFGINSILVEEDTLLLFVLFQLVFLLLYFVYKKKRYLLVWFLFMLFQVLSFRRSGFSLALLTSSSFFFLYYIRVLNPVKKVVYSVTVLLILVIGTSSSFILHNQKYSIYLHRYLGEFVEIPGSYYYNDIARNKHIIQAMYGFEYAIENLGFWGFGYGKFSERNRLTYYSNTGIHNAYYSLWESRGLFALIYYLIIIVVFIGEIIKTIKHYRAYDVQFLLMRSCVIIYLFWFFINAWVLILDNLTSIKMVFTLILLLGFLFKVNNNNYKYLLAPRTVKGNKFRNI